MTVMITRVLLAAILCPLQIWPKAHATFEYRPSSSQAAVALSKGRRPDSAQQRPGLISGQ
jgi:hypothetical protein